MSHATNNCKAPSVGALRELRAKLERWLGRLVRLFGLIPRSDVLATFADPVRLRTNILHWGPPGYDIYDAEQIERIKAEAIRESERARFEYNLRRMRKPNTGGDTPRAKPEGCV